LILFPFKLALGHKPLPIRALGTALPRAST
jgi:hypothetical protein